MSTENHSEALQAVEDISRYYALYEGVSRRVPLIYAHAYMFRKTTIDSAIRHKIPEDRIHASVEAGMAAGNKIYPFGGDRPKLAELKEHEHMLTQILEDLFNLDVQLAEAIMTKSAIDSLKPTENLSYFRSCYVQIREKCPTIFFYSHALLGMAALTAKNSGFLPTDVKAHQDAGRRKAGQEFLIQGNDILEKQQSLEETLSHIFFRVFEIQD